MASSVEFDPVDSIAVGTVGPPGQRQFFLRARGAAETVVLNCEKFHIQGLVVRVRQLLEAQGLESALEGAPPPPAAPSEAAWSIGELGLGYHESRQRFVIVARERPGESELDEAADPAEPAEPVELPGEEPVTARFWATADQVRVFAAQAESVLAGGRKLCNHCGLPIDPSGHPCPAANGARPIF